MESRARIRNLGAVGCLSVVALVVFGLFWTGSTFTAASLNGQVLGAGPPIANSMVTLWAASASAPKQLAQARTGADGRFTLDAATPGKDAILYLVAKGAHPPLIRQPATTPPSRC